MAVFSNYQAKGKGNILNLLKMMLGTQQFSPVKVKQLQG